MRQNHCHHHDELTIDNSDSNGILVETGFEVDLAEGSVSVKEDTMELAKAEGEISVFASFFVFRHLLCVTLGLIHSTKDGSS